MATNMKQPGSVFEIGWRLVMWGSAAGLLSLVKLRKTADTCPRCGSRVVAFGHAEVGGQGKNRIAH